MSGNGVFGWESSGVVLAFGIFKRFVRGERLVGSLSRYGGANRGGL